MLVAVAMQAQNADRRISALIGENRWFDLAHELKVTPKDSVSPFIRKLALAMTHHHFNRPDSACAVFGDLLNNHQAELAGNTLNIAVLTGMNLARADHYTEASYLVSDICRQLLEQGADSTQIGSLLVLSEQYSIYADNGPVCRQLHSDGIYTVPMGIHSSMHAARDRNDEGHFITMDGRINGCESTLVFDTGAGVNIVSTRQAREFGLRLLDGTLPLSGISSQTGRYAFADTLNIGEMAWSNVPFIVVDLMTGNPETDSIGTLLPPVIGLPLMFRMQEITMDFGSRQFIIRTGSSSGSDSGSGLSLSSSTCQTADPRTVSCSGNIENGRNIQKPYSNLIVTDSGSLCLSATDEDGDPLLLHFDTGGYRTTMLPSWYARHKYDVHASGTPDTLRAAGVGGVKETVSYILPHRKFRIGNATAVLDSVSVDTGTDIHTGESRTVQYIEGSEDGTLGLDLLEHFKYVTMNLKDMYLHAVPNQNPYTGE